MWAWLRRLWRRVTCAQAPAEDNILTVKVFLRMVGDHLHQVQTRRGGWHQILRNDPCVYCGGVSTTIEHVTPTAARRSAGNKVGACYACNNGRGAAPLLVYLVWIRLGRRGAFKQWRGPFLKTLYTGPNPPRPKIPVTHPARYRQPPLTTPLGELLRAKGIELSRHTRV